MSKKVTPKANIQPAPKKTTKIQMVKYHLIKKGNITSWEAINLFAATRLSAIIHNLRKSGYNISTTPLTQKDKFGNTVNFAKYKLISVPKVKS